MSRLGRALLRDPTASTVRAVSCKTQKVHFDTTRGLLGLANGLYPTYAPYETFAFGPRTAWMTSAMIATAISAGV